jgi:nucleotide-binding universal stress UspA family protein
VPGEIKTQIQARRGAEVIEIINAAKSYMAGLMVISTHGLTGRAHALAGSLAENMVQLAPCPVLVVREHECDFIETNAGHAPATHRQPHFAAAI